MADHFTGAPPGLSRRTNLIRLACSDKDETERLEAILVNAGYSVVLTGDADISGTPSLAGIESLQRWEETERLVAKCAATLLDATDDQLDHAIGRVLRLCGEFIAADRAYLFLLSADGTLLSNTHEWCAQGVAPQRHALQNEPVASMPWWWERISQNDLISIPSVAALPPGAAAERAMFEAQATLALFAFALRKSGRTFGFVGCDAVRPRAPWSDREIAFIGTVGTLISSALYRAEAETLAHRHQEVLRLGQIAANIGTWEWNVRTGELLWSERMAPLLGRSDDPAPTMEAFLDAIPTVDRDSVVAAVTACVQQGHPFDIEHRVIWQDGTTRWLLERGAVIRDADGKAERMLGVVQDIDERKQLELTLAKREHLLTTILDTTQQGFWFITPDGLTTDLNPAMCRILGRSREEVVGHSVYEYVDTENHHVFEYELGRRRQGLTTPYELALLKSDGSLVHCINTPSMLQDENGRIVAYVGIWTDVSELRRIQDDLHAVNERLSAAYEEAERANRAKSDFLSSMSHELRTPMNSILGFGQLLECDASLPDEQQDNVREILRAGRHLLALINEVLDLAKVESGKIDLSIEPVRLAPLVDECIALLQVIADGRSIALHVGELGDIAIHADRTRLKQALLNLLSNAIKYNRPDGQVRLMVAPDSPGMLRIDVIDNGPGIPADKQCLLFQPFNRLDAEHTEIEGTGIGLTLTRRVVEMMGGRIGVDSAPGDGSRFWITLPTAESEATDTLPASPPLIPDASPRTPGKSRHLVLYVEDNPANLKLVANIIGRRADIDLLTAHSAELGLELARARRPELILLDINMPGMNGYQVMGVLKASPTTRHIPVVAVTANAMRRDIQRGLQAGFSDYLTKPIDIDRFNALLDERLSGVKSIESGDH